MDDYQTHRGKVLTRGTLYLVGVGPGDPELLTLKAARILAEMDNVAFPQKPGVNSLALSIAKPHLSENASFFPIDLPMEKSREPGKQAYDLAAKKISELLNEGKSVAYLCEGDPLFYGSAMYLIARLSGGFEIQIIPGITSLNAATAALGRPLVARSERLKVLPATLSDAEIAAELSNCESVAILKTGRHFPRIRALLRQSGHGENTFIIEHASGSNQVISSLEEYAKETLPYFAILLCYNGEEVWANKNWVTIGKQN